MGKPLGAVNKPRERMLRRLEQEFPDFCPVARMLEQAEAARADIDERHAEYLKFRETGELPTAGPEGGAGEMEQVTPPARISAGERNILHGMYQRTAKFLVPELRSSEVKVDGDLGGNITVRFLREGEDAPSGN